MALHLEAVWVENENELKLKYLIIIIYMYIFIWSYFFLPNPSTIIHYSRCFVITLPAIVELNSYHIQMYILIMITPHKHLQPTDQPQQSNPIHSHKVK